MGALKLRKWSHRLSLLLKNE